jgi:amidophosphoribosyltransferase
MIVIDQEGVRSLRPFASVPVHRCLFEWVYFARPDSTIDGRSVYRARERMGRRLAIEHAVPADVVIAVPDSGVAAAIGYARESGVPYDQGLMRSHYVGRTFIEPSQQIRHFGVKLKLSPVTEVLRGKRVVVVDDSIVRGTTSRKILAMIRNAGATEVHLRISSPPTVGPCRYGIDTPTREELIASNHSSEQIRDFIGADTLGYLSLQGLYAAVNGSGPEVDEEQKRRSLKVLQEPAARAAEGFCDACFSGNYPVPSEPPSRVRQLRLISA